jgi:hypothetical protein
LNDYQSTADKQCWYVGGDNYPIHAECVREHAIPHRLNDRIDRIQRPNNEEKPDQRDGPGLPAMKSYQCQQGQARRDQVTVSDHFLKQNRHAYTDGSWGQDGPTDHPEGVYPYQGSKADSRGSLDRRGATYHSATSANAAELSVN